MRLINPRNIQPDDDLRKAAEHVNYEIRMLVFSSKYLDGCQSSPLTRPEGSQENMALESFLLHFRNLRSFLCPRLGRVIWSDDILASDYLKKVQPENVGDIRKLAGYKERIDKMLTQLSSTRDRFIEARNYAWPIAQMLLAALDELEVFFAMLSPEMRAWFPTVDQIALHRAQASVYTYDVVDTTVAVTARVQVNGK
jgi:hypothetical protein